ncbi:hypothetical protein D3C85_1765060 [compost metagenome]
MDSALTHHGLLYFDLHELLNRRSRAMDDRITLVLLGQLFVRHAVVRLFHPRGMASELAPDHQLVHALPLYTLLPNTHLPRI